MENPEIHVMQSFVVLPSQEEHGVTQGSHVSPLLNDPVGHVEFFVTVANELHFAVSVISCLKPSWQDLQVPVTSSQLVHPR
jgi:hypothetical protein